MSFGATIFCANMQQDLCKYILKFLEKVETRCTSHAIMFDKTSLVFMLPEYATWRKIYREKYNIRTLNTAQHILSVSVTNRGAHVISFAVMLFSRTPSRRMLSPWKTVQNMHKCVYECGVCELLCIFLHLICEFRIALYLSPSSLPTSSPHHPKPLSHTLQILSLSTILKPAGKFVASCTRWHNDQVVWCNVLFHLLNNSWRMYFW